MQNVKHVTFEHGKNIYFSTYPPPTSLYQCVETRSIEVFWLSTQPLPHLVGHYMRLSNVLHRISRPKCEPLYATSTSHRKQETFPYEYPLHWVILLTRKRTTELCSSIVRPQARSPFWLLKPASEHVHARLLPRLSWSSTVLLPSHTHYAHCSCVTSVCDLFTDSPLY
jgi:hypothetical protein